MLKLGTISLDGTKVHADASKRKAVSYKRLLELEAQLRAEVEDLFALSEHIDQPEVPDGLVVHEEIARRQDCLARLAERERTAGRRPRGRPPTPPTPGPHDGDHYNFSATSTYL